MNGNSSSYKYRITAPVPLLEFIMVKSIQFLHDGCIHLINIKELSVAQFSNNMMLPDPLSLLPQLYLLVPILWREGRPSDNNPPIPDRHD